MASVLTFIGPTCRRLSGADEPPDWTKVYPEVFAEGTFQKLLKSYPGLDYEVQFKNDPGFLQSKVYPLTVKEDDALKDWIKENTENGRLEWGES